MKRFQEPRKPYPYNEENISFKSKKDDITLHGTLTAPKSDGPFPAIILISGSGPQNRDEEIAGHKPFLVLADHLTRSGIAVLRFDDRGLGESVRNYFNKVTASDCVNDVLGAIDFLKSRMDIDNKQIGLLGHSEGGNIASMVASQCDDISFVVLFAGPGLAGDEIMLRQYDLIFRARGMKENRIAQQISFFQSVFDVVKKERENTKAKQEIKAVYESHFGKINIFKKDVFKRITDVYLSPWMRFFIAHQPSDDLKLIKCPVLALIGDKDIQVPSKENLNAIEKALKEGNNKDFTALEIPGVNHLFQTAKTGNIAEYRKIKETISPVVLGIIEKWIRERVIK
jgi:dienelactone hydrolase